MNDLNQGIAAHQAGRLEEAAKHYLKHLRHHSDHQAHQLLGMIYSASGENKDAIKHMQSSLQINDKQPHVHNSLAICLKRTGKFDDAIKHYKLAINQIPDYVDAYRNLSLLLWESGEAESANQYLEAALRINARDPALLSLLGRFQKESGNFNEAIASFSSSLEQRPGHPATVSNLGVAYRLNNQPTKALIQYQQLLDQNIQSFELFHNIGNAYSDLGKLDLAIRYYEKALELNPGYVESHRNLSDLLWSLGKKDEFIKSYDKVLRSEYESDELKLSRAETLLAAEQPERIIELLDERPVTNVDNPDYFDLLARTYLALGDGPKSLELHEKACSLSQSNSHSLQHAVSLLHLGDVEAAVELLEQIFTMEPANQLALAHLTLCWRLLGDERVEEVDNYKDLVGTYTLPVPAGYRNLEEFNEALNHYLTSVHTSNTYPYEQTLRGGTQTQGNLFAREDKELEPLIESLSACVIEHLKHIQTVEKPFPAFPQEPGFNFSASWSVRLKDQGFHTMHVHPMGWFSSAYYVDLPPSIDDSTQNGWLTFGKPNFDIDLDTQFAIKPEPGHLALFPSYMWHGTLPFDDDHPRTTVVFDIVPARTVPARTVPAR